MEYVQDTVFISGKKKRTVTVEEIYERIEKGIKKKGPTKEWTSVFDEDKGEIYIYFNDGQSEDFHLSFDKNDFECICKLYLPYDEASSTEDMTLLTTLLDILYRIRTKLNTITVSDDYGLAESYWEGKRYKFKFRELTTEEVLRAERLYNAGYTRHEDFLRAVMAEDMEMDVNEFKTYENPDISHEMDHGYIQNSLETYIYETSDFGNEGRVSDMLPEFTCDPNKYMFALWTFSHGVAWAFGDGSCLIYDLGAGFEGDIEIKKHYCRIPNEAQVDLLYNNFFAPLYIEEKDSFKRCVLAYRYFLSVYDFCGFKFTGHQRPKLVTEEILERYGMDVGREYLALYITSEKYIFSGNYSDGYGDRIINNALSRYGKDFMERYIKDFKRVYEENHRFRLETQYYADIDSEYVDDTLIE